MELKTPLYDCHVAGGGKIVPFAGYLLPVQYPTGVIAEHMAVRNHAGLFDVSHMGEVMITGPDAFANIQNLFTNDFTSMTDEMCIRDRYYSAKGNPDGILEFSFCNRPPQSWLFIFSLFFRQKRFFQKLAPPFPILTAVSYTHLDVYTRQSDKYADNPL